MDAITAALYAAPFGLALTAAAAAGRRRPPRAPRQIRQLVKQPASRKPQPEVQQRPGWGPDSQLTRPWWETP